MRPKFRQDYGLLVPAYNLCAMQVRGATGSGNEKHRQTVIRRGSYIVAIIAPRDERGETDVVQNNPV